MYLQELIIYNTLSKDPIINKYISFIEASGGTEIRQAYFELVKELITVEMTFDTYLYTKMIEVDNPILERLSNEMCDISELDKACLKNDLAIIKEIIGQNVNDKLNEVNDQQGIFRHLKDSKASLLIIKAYRNYFELTIEQEDIRSFIALLRNYGTGKFANNRVFYLNQKGQLIFVKDFSPLPWEQIYDYQIQKEALLNNTKALVEGKAYHHVILEGASGTGKSSSVKAVVDLFKDDKLRLIQLYKNQICYLPKLLEELYNSVFKFIIYIDDLSFEINDDDYKLLKSYIEGGIINEGTNIAFYVTSNRQHLIKEVRAEREGDIHLQDFIQETTSLSSRFGLHLTFMKPSQDDYFEMIIKMLEYENISFNREEIEIEAKRWALRHRGMSGRVAMQFVKHLKMLSD